MATDVDALFQPKLSLGPAPAKIIPFSFSSASPVFRHKRFIPPMSVTVVVTPGTSPVKDLGIWPTLLKEALTA